MDNLNAIQICSQKTAESLTPQTGVGIISISGPNKVVNLKPGWDPILVLKFNDVTANFGSFVCFDWGLAHNLLDWLDEHLSSLSGLIIHCEQGRSRSQAIGMFIQKYYASHLPVPEGPHGKDGYNGKVYSVAEKAYLARNPV
jgi:predicted protein tyrosine phosphatase